MNNSEEDMLQKKKKFTCYGKNDINSGYTIKCYDSFNHNYYFIKSNKLAKSEPKKKKEKKKKGRKNEEENQINKLFISSKKKSSINCSRPENFTLKCFKKRE